MKLKELAEEYGYDDIFEAIEGESWHTDSIVPGICNQKDCPGQLDSVEPDATGYKCPECGKDSVASVLIRAGIM